MEELPFQSILHPTDYSPGSKPAFAHALRLAIAAHSSLHLLHVDNAGQKADWDRFPDPVALLKQWKMLDASAGPEDARRSLGVELTRNSLDSADVAGTISSFAEQTRCDLMVLLTHGSSLMGRILNGSVAEASARLTQAPALFLHEGQRGFVDQDNGRIRLHRILMPVAADVPPMHAWGIASKFVRGLDPLAEFHMLHVGDTLPTFGNMLPYVDLKRGPVVETILEIAEQAKPDLIVMATAGHQDLFDDLRGSTTERVMRKAPCPVLAIPEHARRKPV